jgi:hypothetical protein
VRNLLFKIRLDNFNFYPEILGGFLIEEMFCRIERRCNFGPCKVEDFEKKIRNMAVGLLL